MHQFQEGHHKISNINAVKEEGHHKICNINAVKDCFGEIFLQIKSKHYYIAEKKS